MVLTQSKILGKSNGLSGVGCFIPGCINLLFHRARKEKELWEVEERQALLQAEKAAMSGGDVEVTESVTPHGDEA